MMKIKSFKFNPFEENTYLLYHDNGEALVIDPGAYFEAEQKTLLHFLSSERLRPVRLLQTHAHLDHVLGCRLIFNHFSLKPELHALDKPILDNAVATGQQYGLSLAPPPEAGNILSEEDTISLGEDTLSILFTPGHSPGSICFYCPEQHFLIGGDVLFRESIGRTDLPGGHHETLLQSIREKIFTLPEETVVYPGHGPATTVGHEREHNPFVKG